jgi:septum formation topological specificity factor MinE
MSTIRAIRWMTCMAAAQFVAALVVCSWPAPDCSAQPGSRQRDEQGPPPDERRYDPEERPMRRPPPPGRPIPYGQGPSDPRPGDGRPSEPRPSEPPFGGRRGPPPGGMLPPHEWERLRQDDPEMHALFVEDEKLDRQTLELASRLRRAAADSRDKLREELADVVTRHFETRQKRRELQLKRMEEEIERLRAAIAERNKAREKIVADRIEELTGDANPLEF